ncbi:MAG: cutinase family protein [Mycobacterium sp.]
MNHFLGPLTFAAVAAASAVIGTPVAAAAPSSCSDVEVVFARGTFEPAGLGRMGDAFVSELRSQLPGQSVSTYAVNYPASLDFGGAADGVADASNHLQDVVARCPSTEIVLGGYSQGAAVSGYVTSDSVPAGFALPAGISGPMPAAVADRVAAVALFGKPSPGIIQLAHQGAPPIAIGAPYASKTIELCATADPVCAPGGLDRAAHSSYVANGMTTQAAEFAARHLQQY